MQGRMREMQKEREGESRILAVKEENWTGEGMRLAGMVGLPRAEQVPSSTADILEVLVWTYSHLPAGEGIPQKNLRRVPKALLDLPPTVRLRKGK